MTIINVTVKWKSNIYNNLELNVAEPVILFKQQLCKLTNVPPEKQKLMYKGLIKDDADLSKLNIKNNDKIMLVGSAESLVEKPHNVVFIEDLSKEDKEKLHEKENIIFEDQGIVNLGNTCYFNAVLQFLTSFDDLGEFLKNFKRKEKFLLKTPKDILFDCYIHFSQTFGKSSEPYVPLELLKSFREVFPKFKSVNLRTKQYAQQDAEECMNAILNSLNEESECKIIDELFSFKIVSKIKLIENDATENDRSSTISGIEKESAAKTIPTSENVTEQNSNTVLQEEYETTEEFHNKLICYMGTHATPVNHMHEGIHLSLNEKIRKNKAADSKEDALYEKKSEINSLPPYLIVHFLRFESKRIVESNNGVSVVTAKICRKVSFPETFDIYDFCSENIKSQLKIARNIIMKRREPKGGDISPPLDMVNLSQDGNKSDTAKNDEVKNDEMKNEGGKNDEVKNENEQTSNKKNNDQRCDKKEGMNIPTGEYELISVITHKGRNEESGHYIAWKKMRKCIIQDCRTDDMDQINKKNTSSNDAVWYKMDDDKVSTCKFVSNDLCGGCSDFNIAILLLYKRKTLSCTQEEIDKYIM
ncbi:ubiquitin carboxyl-terminal hydrolase 14, putative [Plasmodium malariae]|uniref:Ubiquitin carboxyl-terminal hydrolase n=1 Tax=Plasmodium malariae TaxID=5858 RepID=A0A1C3KDD1_PLAMA|nr:ubiquitin carboxyl-terminal hydrolase 14, putative [Plasmodium malariae]